MRGYENVTIPPTSAETGQSQLNSLTVSAHELTALFSDAYCDVVLVGDDEIVDYMKVQTIPPRHP